MRRTEVLALDAKATYKGNRLYAMTQNTCPRDARQPIVMIPLTAIAFRHIYLANPIILFVRIRMLSEAVEIQIMCIQYIITNICKWLFSLKQTNSNNKNKKKSAYTSNEKKNYVSWSCI